MPATADTMHMGCSWEPLLLPFTATVAQATMPGESWGGSIMTWSRRQSRCCSAREVCSSQVASNG